MKTATLKELKAELSTLPSAQLLDLCMHLVKYKKENKELLTYLLFEANDEASYINKVEQQIDELFEAMNRSTVYLTKKSIRKIIKTTNKFIKYSGSKQTEVELRIFVCDRIKSSGIPLYTSTALDNMYQRQILSIKKAIATLHEDLQYDYSKELEHLL